ncbi:hypothetical protein E2C01_061004 [Portunus trituberculatus]|uniref:Uncharacterized protein n=1 Tax=Portunus trituberculatus TaxID=210409 RepID=A0A5B7HAK9_PORTR|nr:hypothetical protein [Portunus trituberculatus]
MQSRHQPTGGGCSVVWSRWVQRAAGGDSASRSARTPAPRSHHRAPSWCRSPA